MVPGEYAAQRRRYGEERQPLLGEDIVRTAVAPSWTDIGQLAAIGVIRTFLNYFLEKDLEKYEPRGNSSG